MKWEFKLHSEAEAGVTSTGDSLVFAGTNEGDFFALDAPTELSDRRQATQVAIASGSSIFAFALSE